MLRNNSAAPDFALRDEHGVLCRLADLRRSKPMLLLFFRGAFCPTARRDLLAYSDVCERIRSCGGSIAGISTDSPDALLALQQRLDLQFALLSDEDFAVSERYGVYRSDETEEGPQPHGEPAVFVLDVDGNIAYSQVQTGPKGCAFPSEMALIFLHMSRMEGRYR